MEPVMSPEERQGMEEALHQLNVIREGMATPDGISQVDALGKFTGDPIADQYGGTDHY